MLALGLFATAASAAFLVWLTLRPGAQRSYPAYGWVALAALAALELLLALRVSAITSFFTSLVWTAFIPAVDAAVRRRRNDSLLCHPRAFIALAALSIPGWLVFEGYNLRLRNWAYAGVPRHFWVFALGASWAFSTIYPGIFETADLIHSAWTQNWNCRRCRISPATEWGMVLAGAACLVVPFALPTAQAPYAFALVWAGFIFFFDPINRRLGWPSLLGQLERGRPGFFIALLLSGAVCGFFWEFWNFWASARWVYIFPILHRYRIFAMPFPGFLGFPPFALECFAMYVFFAHLLLPSRFRMSLWRGRASNSAAASRAAPE